MKCQRCKKNANGFTRSIFNTQTICMDCGDKERNHPMYEKAKEVEAEAVRKGDYRFLGIGLPVDL